MKRYVSNFIHGGMCEIRYILCYFYKADMDGKSAVVFLPVWKTILPKSGLFVGGGVKRKFGIVGKNAIWYNSII